MNKSEQIEKLAAALAMVHAELKSVKMDAYDDFHSNHYTTLGAILDASKPITGKYGLIITQFPVSEDGKVGVSTWLIHAESGQYINEVAMFPQNDEKGMKAAQVAGSTISYIRRYALAAILQIYSDQDDDGNGVKSQEKPKVAPQNINTPQPTPKAQFQPSKMTLNDAADIVGKDGKRYGDNTTEELTFKFNALSKANKQDPNDLEVARKMEAAKLLIDSRKGN